jgi:hypothetical protein
MLMRHLKAKLRRSSVISDDAVKVAIHRLRKRFRDAVKAEIAQTVSDLRQRAR